MSVNSGDIKFSVQIDFEDTGLFNGTYDDITADTLSFEFRRGRNFPLQLIGRATPMKCQIICKNIDGKFSEYNVDSDLYGRLDTTHKVRIKVLEPIEQIVCVGRLSKITPISTIVRVPTVTLEVEGMLAQLIDVPLSVSLQKDIKVSDAVVMSLEAAGLSSNEYNVRETETILKYWGSDNCSVLDKLRDLEATETGFVHEDYLGRIVFDGSGHRLRSIGLESPTFAGDNDNEDELHLSEVSVTRQQQYVFNHVSIPINNFVVESTNEAGTGDAVLWELSQGSTLIVNAQSQIYIRVEVDAFAVESFNSVSGIIARTSEDGTGTDISSSITATLENKAYKTVYVKLQNSHPTDRAYVTSLQGVR